MNEATPVYLTNKTTGEVKSFDTVAILQRTTGISVGSIYRRLSGTVKEPLRLKLGDTLDWWYVTNKPIQKLVAADPNAEYIVHDGNGHTYHKGSLEECKQIKKLIGFPTLKLTPYVNTSGLKDSPKEPGS